MLIDDVTIKVTAGSGGRGAVAFNNVKMNLGPTGASGGNGGSIYFEGVADITTLSKFRNKKDWEAEDGKDGRSQFRDGHAGEDIILKVPVGTVIHALETKTEEEITKIGERLLITKGGHGGKGNFHFRSPKNTSPRRFQEGLPGEHRTLRLELKLIADIGLIGLPNVGKSSLLNELTNAKSKVGNYFFTTLEPSLGVYYDLILADIPGLIEGASNGKGLGGKFLRHIERTRVLFHIVSAESPSPVKDYKTVRKELGAYNKSLLKKTEYLFLSKSDLIDQKELKKKLTALKKCNFSLRAFSVYDFASIEAIKKIFSKISKEK